MKTIFISTLFICMTCGLTARAQKLPNLQAGSVIAPAKVRIDGKVTEWPPFMSFNRSVNAFYTIANDAENIYLVMQVTDDRTIRKVIGGNITFTIMPNKKAGSPALITFPFLPAMAKNLIVRRHGSRDKRQINSSRYNDSLLLLLNSTIANNCKEIAIKGLQGQADGSVSVYNSEGIKATINFDKRCALNYEAALPLAYLKATIGDTVFNYKIQFNAISFSDLTTTTTTLRGTETRTYTSRLVSGGADRNADLNSATSLKGSYTLAK